ncbi:hypothetical protein yc1106_08946 [Curvularia clavata]|uniref:Uncharacterized protein n=1 Tax=Curvularia clavata TaxID=95742 RepID=A0A9Q8ZE77_CURCL|nr:hypothetical protein yc1106_08946 [Curvularia clavata]
MLPKLIQRPSDAPSLVSDTTFTPTPKRRKRGTTDSDTASNSFEEISLSQQTPSKPQLKLEPYYTLAPTVPSPFSGTLEASLDAILIWSQRICPAVTSVQRLVSALLEAVHPDTNWPSLLEAIYLTPTMQPEYARDLVTELLFLVTRTLLPEQIAENRAALERLYETRKTTAIRFLLRYDMLREWEMQPGSHRRDQPVAVPAVESERGVASSLWIPAAYAEKHPFRRPLMVNVISTLIAAPPGGYSTLGMRERMKHYVTDLDAYLMLRDEEVEKWSTGRLNVKTCFALLHWQWLRQNNERLEDMEVHGWEELEGKAEENEWIADDTRKKATGITAKREMRKEE